jgi:uncharacterized linocin/CFP29 family protein
MSGKAWDEIDEEARRTLQLHMGARKLLDFVGPTRWDDACVNRGRTNSLSGFGKGVDASYRLVQPLLELRAPFSLPRAELEDIDRGCPDPDLDAVVAAAKRIAHAEGRTLFEGSKEAGVRGLSSGADDPETLPGVVADATNVLRERGIEGPYGLAVGPRGYTGLVQAPAAGGYPVLDRLRNVISGPIVWAPSLDGALLLSMRGGDFELHVGQDASVGYVDHDEAEVRFHLVETFTLRNLTPEAAVPLRYKG